MASRRARGWTYGFPLTYDGYLHNNGEEIDPAEVYGVKLAALATGLEGSSNGDSGVYDPVVFSKRAYDLEAPNWFFGITDAVPSFVPRWLRKRSLS